MQLNTLAKFFFIFLEIIDFMLENTLLNYSASKLSYRYPKKS